MMLALMIGLIVGFLMCIPVGPINVWVVNTFLKHNFKSAFSIALGGSLMDFIYFFLILTGLSFFHFSESMSLLLKVVGVLFLFTFGLKELFAKAPVFENKESNIKQETKGLAGFFLIGVVIYTSNPTLIATMSGLAALIKSWQLFDFNFMNYFLLSVGLAVGSSFWFYLLLKLVEKYREKIPQKFYINFSRTSGVLMTIFSLIMAFKVYREFSL